MKSLIPAFLLIQIVCSNPVLAFEMGEIRGTVFNKETKEPVPFASVAITKGDQIILSTIADERGVYKLKPVSAGEYTLQASFVQYSKTTVEKVFVEANRITFLDIEISQKELPVVIIRGEKLIQKDQTMTVTTYDALEIKESPYRDVKDFISTVPGVVQKEEGGSINIRGSRSESTQYYVDGIKVIGGLTLPKSAVASMSVITGGVPAMYGDATGGIVVITTKSFVGSN